MSTNFYVYLGPAIEVPFHHVATEEVSYGCSAKCTGRSLPANTAFCSQCGAPVEKRLTSKTEYQAMDPTVLANPSLHDLVFAPEAGVSRDTSTSVWLPNLRGHGLTLSNDEGDEVLCDPASLTTEKSLALFESAVEPVLHALRKEHSVEPKIRHVLLTYYL